jgi:hypothetical protein
MKPLPRYFNHEPKVKEFRMNDLPVLLSGLRGSPDILESMLTSIPHDLLKSQRRAGKWSIHAHVCHLPTAQGVLMARFRQFQREAAPEFIPYQPDQVEGEETLITLNLVEEVARFRSLREELLSLAVQETEAAFWNKEARHPEYFLYTPLIMLRHILMHDHLHLYRIEDLWLTRPEYL